MEINKEIRRAVDTGKVSFGQRQCLKNLASGKGELVIVSENLPRNEKEKVEHMAKIENKKFYVFSGNGLTLGSICGKPFVVSTMLVLDAGKSKVLEAVQ
ncbi:MAG: 50S ribosomal protein L30e [Candidatus Diapherotrites archaeon]|nr:50S ribosomal protein L30e [Candidatus Diapherotrites archaeon]